MIRINVAEAKRHLSQYLTRVERGEVVVLCRRNVPIAELRPVSRASERRRPWGLAKGEVEIPDDFDAPLPDDTLADWEGRD
jgi:prevent-host-death family protein